MSIASRKITLFFLLAVGLTMLFYDAWACSKDYQHTITFVVRKNSRESQFLPVVAALTFGYWLGKSRCIGPDLDDTGTFLPEEPPSSKALRLVAWPAFVPVLANALDLDAAPIATYLVAGMILILLAFNLRAAFDKQPDDSIGDIFVALIRKNPLVPYYMGFVSGHLWWP